DEKDAPAGAPFKHAWGGVARLRADVTYRTEFNSAFGCWPTQDTVGKALATYLRTLLSGNSLHDRAARPPNRLTVARADYKALLDAPTLAGLKQRLHNAGVTRWENADVDAVADALFAGWQSFVGGREKDNPARCTLCHDGPTFSDRKFHNLGAGAPFDPQSGQ